MGKTTLGQNKPSNSILPIISLAFMFIAFLFGLCVMDFGKSQIIKEEVWAWVLLISTFL